MKKQFIEMLLLSKIFLMSLSLNTLKIKEFIILLKNSLIFSPEHEFMITEFLTECDNIFFGLLPDDVKNNFSFIPKQKINHTNILKERWKSWQSLPTSFVNNYLSPVIIFALDMRLLLTYAIFFVFNSSYRDFFFVFKVSAE